MRPWKSPLRASAASDSIRRTVDACHRFAPSVRSWWSPLSPDSRPTPLRPPPRVKTFIRSLVLVLGGTALVSAGIVGHSILWPSEARAQVPTKTMILYGSQGSTRGAIKPAVVHCVHPTSANDRVPRHRCVRVGHDGPVEREPCGMHGHDPLVLGSAPSKSPTRARRPRSTAGTGRKGSRTRSSSTRPT